MKGMKVVLKEDYPSLGFVGDAVSVKGGYARNFLIPRGVAVEAGSSNARQLQHVIAGINAVKARKKAEADEFRKRLEGLNLEFPLKLGAQGKSFGAVTAHDIEIELQKQGVKLDRKQIRLHEPIKSGGAFPVNVKLHSEVTAVLNIKVNVEVVASPEKTDEGLRGRDRREKAEERDAADGGDVKTPKGSGRKRKSAAAEDGSETGSESE